MKGNNRGFEIVHYKTLILSVVMILSACSELPAEQAIKENIEEIQSAIEGKSSSGVTEHLSSYFLLNNKMDKKGVKRMLMASFLRHQKIGIIVSNVTIELSETDTHRAVSTATVALVGATNFIPDSGRLYQLKGEWQIEGSDWRLLTLNWK